jgi:hypothetical protein
MTPRRRFTTTVLRGLRLIERSLQEDYQLHVDDREDIRTAREWIVSMEYNPRSYGPGSYRKQHGN